MFGVATGTTATGVQGKSTSGAGVRGDSSSNNGVVGATTGGNGTAGVVGQFNGTLAAGQIGSGVQGSTTIAGAVGVYGVGAVAGRFDGDMQVNGNFNATGTKSAIVVASDGVTRQLYCMESPESWFEDYAEARVSGAPVAIEIASDFASVVNLDKPYHVFVTPLGDCNGLFVSEKTNHGFVVSELRGGSSNVAFSFRIIAKRRDVEAPRLNRTSLPQRVQPNQIPNVGPAPASPPPPVSKPIPTVNFHP